MSESAGKNLKYDLDSAVFISVLILGISFFTLVSEIGFSPSYTSVFIICGLAILLATFPLAYRLIVGLPDAVGVDSALTVLLLLFILVSSFLPTGLVTKLAFVCSLLGFASLMFLFVKSVGRNNLTKLFTWILFPFLLTIWIVGFLHVSGIHHPLYLEKLSMGIINRDLLFHSSIAEMIRTYGVPSTGLYGTPYVPYHYGSHLLIAGFSNFLGISALKAYNILYPIVFIPLYFRVMLYLIKDLTQIIFKDAVPIATDWLFWLTFTIINVNILPNNFLSQNWAIWDSWLISESYLTSLCFLFLSISIFLSLLSPNSKVTLVTYSCLLSVTLLLTGLSKISVILVAAATYPYIVLRSGKWRSPLFIAVGIILLVVMVLSMKMVGASQASENFYPFHFIKIWTNESWRPLFAVAFYFFLIVYILIRVNSYQIKSFEELKLIFRTKQLLDIEILLVIAAAGLAPTMLFLIEGGSAYYFIDIQTRVALVFLLTWVLYRRNKDVSQTQVQGSLTFYLRKNSFLVLVGMVFFLYNVMSKLEDFGNSNLQLRLSITKTNSLSKYKGDYRDVYHYFAGSPALIKEKAKEIIYLPAKIIYEESRYKYYTWLLDTCRQIEHKEQYLLGISKVTSFWQDGHTRPEMAPFIFPSLTGIALANGLPSDFKDINEYGYPTYRSIVMDSVVCDDNFKKKILLINPYVHEMKECKK